MFKEILVYVRSDGTDELLTFAAQLARRDGAYLTGLCALYGVAMLRKIGRNKPSLANTFIAEEFEKAGAVERRFRAIAENAGLAHGWVLGEGYPMDMLNMFARLQDVVVIGQASQSSSEIDPDVVEELVLTRGQASLVVPRAGTFSVVGKRIVVAWNGSREAAAAVKAARPLIEQAEHVTVLAGQSRENFSSVTRIAESEIKPLDIVTHLRRHTKQVEVQEFEAGDAEAGSAILDQASRLGADLIVMGAYGRPWLSQWILGGATRHVLQNMTIPILMSR